MRACAVWGLRHATQGCAVRLVSFVAARGCAVRCALSCSAGGAVSLGAVPRMALPCAPVRAGLCRARLCRTGVCRWGWPCGAARAKRGLPRVLRVGVARGCAARSGQDTYVASRLAYEQVAESEAHARGGALPPTLSLPRPCLPLLAGAPIRNAYNSRRAAAAPARRTRCGCSARGRGAPGRGARGPRGCRAFTRIIPDFRRLAITE